MRKLLLLIVLSVSCTLAAHEWSDETFVSLLTCGPGEELYAHYGHTAIRICDPQDGTDWVFNYGIFDFNTDHFYWKFVRGETWYQLGASSLESFLFQYRLEQRPVYEQRLRLTDLQRDRLINALLINYEPENRTYLYNFVFDNCATRPYHMILSALGDSIRSTYTGAQGQTYRRYLQHYTGRGSWADFGINLLFGRRSQHRMQGEEALFIPEELMFYLSEATFADGTPVVLKEHIAPFDIQPLPWYQTWYFGIALIILALLALTLIGRHIHRRFYGIDIAFGIVYALLIAIVIFLTFFSIHPLVGFGWRLFILPLVYLCIRLVYYIR